MSPADWETDIKLAKSAHIDGFALNIAASDPNTNDILVKAYTAAQTVGGFTMFFSFDYLSRGVPWSSSVVISLINQYKSRAYTYYRGKPLVSTFEGTGNAGDWAAIKRDTGCFFIPDWSSLGPAGFSSHLNTVDGAFSWEAWPTGANDITTNSDHSWKSVLGSKAYMMPVSPWFYTNLTEWHKNWLWRGDDMWYQRWQQIISFQPDLVEILTWNDYGESHYIGPIYPSGIPRGAWYVNGMPHTGWLAMLPHYIDAYKAGSMSSLAGKPEKISFWYKVNPGLCGSNGGTQGNNPAYQQFTSPEAVSQDQIFLDVLVSSPSDVVITIGPSSTTLSATKAGINHFSVPMNGRTGAVAFQIKRNGQVVVSTTGPAITTSCVNGLVNWNAYAGKSG